jgi:hypothetical protein
MGFALGAAVTLLWPAMSGTDDANTREVGVEWCNNYHGWAPTLSATDDDALGFYNALGTKGWTKVYAYGDDNAWETDFKSSAKGGNDANWADNVDFVYFSGHGNTSGFYFGTTHADHQAASTDCEWGDKDLDWIALSACQVLKQSSSPWNTWGWPVFKGLHTILGMDTSMADTPYQGLYFARFMTGDPNYPSYGQKLTILQAWRQAAWWSLPSDEYCAGMGVNAPNSTINDYLPGFGAQAADSIPTQLWYVRYPCG